MHDGHDIKTKSLDTHVEHFQTFFSLQSTFLAISKHKIHLSLPKKLEFACFKFKFLSVFLLLAFDARSINPLEGEYRRPFQGCLY